MNATKSRKEDRIELRATAAQKRILQEAADATHADLSQFVLRASLTEAEIILSSRSLFVLDDDKWNRLTEMLDTPAAAPNAALKELLTEPSALER
ncbi:MAG: DUF1778 domain-containing protein [Verrucomicrobia bacterium]|nr:DUF1778 domain-containing protein [Verrucomicrobiota bacterium]